MFGQCNNLIYAPAVLPATSVNSDYAYCNMFWECPNLRFAPYIKLQTFSGTYTIAEMFMNCSKLQYIKADFTTTPNTTSSLDFSKGVASTGCFIKASNATWTVKGDYSCPSGWTLITALS